AGLDIVKVQVDLKSGETDLSDLRSKLDKDTAAVFIQTPNFFGVVESALKEVIEETHKFDALSIVYSNPLSLGIFESPGSLGADIVVGDVQGLGVSLNYGGPSAGILGINDEKELLRQLPGRLIGATRTLGSDELGFTMILQTREQHIKREKATSNITTNSSLEAVGAAVYLTLLGSQGLKKLGEAILGRTHYLVKRLLNTSVAEPLFPESLYFREVSIRFRGKKASQVIKLLSSRGVSIGPALSKFYEELSECSLACVTELHTRKDIDFLMTVLEEVLEGV
ncbi:MAG: glycine dehydrogenase, partial [Zestosphaera sp.]